MHKLAATKCIILDQAGQQLAQQMQQSNPELVEQLRRQMGGEVNFLPRTVSLEFQMILVISRRLNVDF